MNYYFFLKDTTIRVLVSSIIKAGLGLLKRNFHNALQRVIILIMLVSRICQYLKQCLSVYGWSLGGFLSVNQWEISGWVKDISGVLRGSVISIYKSVNGELSKSGLLRVIRPQWWEHLSSSVSSGWATVAWVMIPQPRASVPGPSVGSACSQQQWYLIELLWVGWAWGGLSSELQGPSQH